MKKTLFLCLVCIAPCVGSLAAIGVNQMFHTLVDASRPDTATGKLIELNETLVVQTKAGTVAVANNGEREIELNDVVVEPER